MFSYLYIFIGKNIDQIYMNKEPFICDIDMIGKTTRAAYISLIMIIILTKIIKKIFFFFRVSFNFV